MSALNKYLVSSSHLPQDTILCMRLQWSEVEHGRNHLITGQWCEPLTSARDITINVNDSQGTLVQSIECEYMSWCQTPSRFYWWKVNDVNLCREWENLSIRHIDLKVPNIVSKTISWMMSWCRREKSRRRRAMMSPTSTTRNSEHSSAMMWM